MQSCTSPLRCFCCKIIQQTRFENDSTDKIVECRCAGCCCWQQAKKNLVLAILCKDGPVQPPSTKPIAIYHSEPYLAPISSRVLYHSVLMLSAHCPLLSVAVTCLDSANGFRTCEPYLLIPLFSTKLSCKAEIGRGRWLVGRDLSVLGLASEEDAVFEFPQFTLWRPWQLGATLDNLAGFLSRLRKSPLFKVHCRSCICLSTWISIRQRLCAWILLL